MVTKIERWIDLSGLSRKGKDKHIDWVNSVGKKVDFMYDGIIGTIKILEYIDSRTVKIYIENYTNNTGCTFPIENIIGCKLRSILRQPIAITNPELVQFFLDKGDAHKYLSHSGVKLPMLCPVCGTIKNMLIKDLTKNGFSCPACSDGISWPNKFMFNALTQLKVDFINEVTKFSPGFKWIENNYRYDFYLKTNDRNVLVEMDGLFHAKGFFQTYEEIHQRDLDKDRLARDNGYEVIRIDCAYSDTSKRFDYVLYNIFNSELNSILNLDIVDWELANRRATSSNVVLAAQYWNDDLTIKEICEKLGIAKSTAREYLKNAAQLGLCNYSAELSINKKSKKFKRALQKANGKPVIVLHNNVIIGVFPSVAEFSRNSKKICNAYMSGYKASRICRGEQECPNGYSIAYITRNEYELLSVKNPSTTQN